MLKKRVLTMPIFRKKPVEIEAIQWTGENVKEIKNFVTQNHHWLDNELVIQTLEGDHIALKGDFIIKGVKGEFYPCKPDIFEQTYDLVR
jgi:hypothetical protein